MRICHVTSIHPAKDSRIFYKECVSLVKEYEVFLIAPNVNDEYSDGVHIVGVPLPQGRIRRMLSLRRVYKKAIDVNAVVYHLHDPELMRLGLNLQKRGKKVIFDSHEDVPAQLLDKPYLPHLLRKPLSIVYSNYEKRILKQYDAIISVTPHIVERLKQINKNTVLVTNYPVVDVDRKEVPQGIPFADREYVCFAGSISPHYRHEFVLRCIIRTQAKYLLLGPAEESYLQKLMSLNEWDKAVYKGVVPHQSVPDFLMQSFAGIVLPEYRPNAGYKKGTVGVLKMFEYMLAGIPVIATDFDLWKTIVEENQCGICVNPYDVDAIVDAINYYQNNPELAKVHGENGRNAVFKRYNWKTQESVLLDLYNRMGLS